METARLGTAIVLTTFVLPIYGRMLLQMPPPPSSSGGSSIQWWQIFVIVFVGAHLIGCPPFLWYLWKKYTKAARAEAGDKLTLKIQEHYVRSIPLKDIKLATNDFDEANKLGSGGYGVVYRGVTPKGEQWAIKRAHRASEQILSAFENEVDLLSRMHHVNVVSLLGFCVDQNELILVYEYVPNGSLKDYLNPLKAAQRALTFEERVSIAMDAAQGIYYLHSFSREPLIHRDIKSDNILLEDNMQAKVADFGLLKLLPQGPGAATHVTTRVAGTLGYLDPEYQEIMRTTTKSDVYSFGVVLLELATGRAPVTNDPVTYAIRTLTKWAIPLIDAGDYSALIDPKMAGKCPPKAFETFVNIARKCVEEAGENRPSMEDVTRSLQDVKQLLLQHDSTTGSGNLQPRARQGSVDWSAMPASSQDGTSNQSLLSNESRTLGTQGQPVVGR